MAEHVVAYLNVDVASSGSQWVIGGSPSLAPLLKKVAQEVPHPTTEGKTLWDAREDDGVLANATEAFQGNMKVDHGVYRNSMDRKERLASLGSGVDALGSGSDFTVFLQRIGVSLLVYDLRLPLKTNFSFRSLALIKALKAGFTTLSTTIIPSTTAFIGKRYTVTPTLVDM